MSTSSHTCMSRVGGHGQYTSRSHQIQIRGQVLEPVRTGLRTRNRAAANCFFFGLSPRPFAICEGSRALRADPRTPQTPPRACARQLSRPAPRPPAGAVPASRFPGSTTHCFSTGCTTPRNQ
eukprot:3937939-Rhodomonas_salina.1